MNLANKLTIMRIILIPLFLVFILVKDIPYGSLIALLIFVLASITDKVDGYIARSRNQITNFGKFMDPLADKMLVISALIALVECGLIPSWMVIVIIAREFAISGLSMLAASEGLIVAASWWGKIKTVIQIAATMALLLRLNYEQIGFVKEFFESNAVLIGFINYVPMTLMVLSVIATVVSGIDYFIKNRKVINYKK